MTVDKERNKHNNVDLTLKTMECSEDKLPYVPYISSLTPALCGFQLPVSEQNSLFFSDVMVKSRNLIHLTWKKIFFILVINKSKIKGILIC